MKRNCLELLVISACIFSFDVMAQEIAYQDPGDVPEQPQYYQDVNPQNAPTGPNYLDQSHPQQEAPVPANPIPHNKLPNNKIPENKIPNNKVPQNPIQSNPI